MRSHLRAWAILAALVLLAWVCHVRLVIAF